MDISQIGIYGSFVAILVSIVKLNWDNKNKKHNPNDKLKDYVPREVCHLAMKNLEDRIAEVKSDTQEIKDILRSK